MLSSLIEEKNTRYHEAHEGFIHFMFPNFVLFVTFVVKYLFCCGFAALCLYGEV